MIRAALLDHLELAEYVNLDGERCLDGISQ